MNHKLTFHLVRTLVKDMQESLLNYTAIFVMDSASAVCRLESQKVDVCFVKTGENSFVELVWPYSEDSKVFKLLKKRVTCCHCGYKVDDTEQAVAALEEQGFRAMEYFSSEAFEGKRCIFLFSP